MLRISFIILIVGVGLFPLSLLFTHLETTLTNEIWEDTKFEQIGKMTLNPEEFHSFEFTVMAKKDMILQIDIEPEGESLTAQYFTQDGALIKEQKMDRSAWYVLLVEPSQYTNPHFEHGKVFKGIIKNFNDKPVSFDASIKITETPSRPTDYEVLGYLAWGLELLFIPILVLGGIVFVVERKCKKQNKWEQDDKENKEKESTLLGKLLKIIIVIVILFLIWFLFGGTIENILIEWYYVDYTGLGELVSICKDAHPEYYETSDAQCWKDARNDPFIDSPIREIIKP